MWYLLNSFRSLLISQGNLPSRHLSVVNLFSILRTHSLCYLLSISRYPHSFLSNFPNLLVWTLKLCLLNSLRNLLVIHHTVPRILLNSRSILPTHILCNLLRKLCIPHNLHNSVQVVPVSVRVFSLFCATRNSLWYRFLYAPFIWLDFGYIQIFRP